MKKIVLGLILGLSISVTLTALAVKMEMVQVSRNTINLEVNSEKIFTDNFLYEGRTYVQMREIAEMLGKDVGWNSETRTASINDKELKLKEVELKEVEKGYGRFSPANIGDTLTIQINEYSDNYKADIQLKEVVRGVEAWNIIKQVNIYNDEAEDGFEYILAKIKFKLIESDKKVNIDVYDFTLISDKGKEYNNASVVKPEPEYNASLYAGAEHEGYVVFQVEKTDLNPVITFGRNYDGDGGIWFKTYYEGKVSPTQTPTHTTAPTQPPTSTPTPTPNKTNYIEPTKENIKKYLDENFSKLDTEIGQTNFTFSILNNESKYRAYDYWIMVEYDFSFFYDLKYSNKYTDEQTTKVKEQLKTHQEKIAKSLIEKIPNIKLKGEYYYSWYEYPSIREGLKSSSYYSWQNYVIADVLSLDKTYSSSKASTFRWYSDLDDKL